MVTVNTIQQNHHLKFDTAQDTDTSESEDTEDTSDTEDTEETDDPIDPNAIEVFGGYIHQGNEHYFGRVRIALSMVPERPIPMNMFNSVINRGG